jgi:hypothetical protein
MRLNLNKDKDMGPAVAEAAIGAPLAFYGTPMIALLGVLALGGSIRLTLQNITAS